jgi:hypothetical protein
VAHRAIAVCLALFAPNLFAQTFNYGEALQKVTLLL